jgi:glycine/D-amino acid oxidase-like deaminating enzyme
MANNSPWIHQLNHERATKKLREDLMSDIAVIGAGIAGVSTAFYLLKHTEKKVVMLEGYKLAHGATGHNGGHMVTYFERQFDELVSEFGLDMACDGQRDVNSAWELAEEMYTDAGLDIPMTRFESYSGLSTKEQLLRHLENDYLRRKGGLHSKVVEIWEGADFIHEIPAKYHDHISLVSREEIALKLETFDPQYVAVLSSQKGVMNSALFCQEVVSYLLESYADRFALYEYTPVNKVVLHEDRVIIDAEDHTVTCEKAVLCTNGFEGLDVIAAGGLAVNARYHHNIHGIVGYMSAYLEPYTGVPMANSYFPKVDPGLTDNPGEPYFYVTRRPFEYEKEKSHNLICIGGPDHSLEHHLKYDRDLEFSEDAGRQIDDFVRRTYDKKSGLEYLFMWHGVMGYTRNMLRMVGPDPSYPNLYYNLGCNGVGLLPSIFAGSKVARQIKGESFDKSIFDVPMIVSREGLSEPIEKADLSAGSLG